MEKFYNTLFLDPSRCKRFTSLPHAFFSGRITLCLVVMMLLLNASAFAQDATFFENFDNTETGALPEGWTYYQRGGTNPDSRWIVSTYGFFGPRVAWSNWSDAADTEGGFDEDWLISPQITPKAGDFLIFDFAQEFVHDDFGSELHMLVSTTTNSPAAFTTTLATYTEADLPGYLHDAKISIDLSAYANKPIYIAFAHKNPSTDIDFAEDFYFDNIWVRPPQSADYFAGELSSQFTTPMRVGKSSTYILIGIKLTVAGDYGTANVTSFDFTSTGTTDPSKIVEARLYSTGKDSFISSNDDEGTVDATLFGSVPNPGESFTITGNTELVMGDNFFWMVFVFTSDYEVEYPFPAADATFEAVTINGVDHPATITDIEGAAVIVPTYPVNDSLAHAMELSPDPARYASYNNNATVESQYEQLAYCAPDGYYDVMNTLWWHFKAPAEGKITADLSATQFNTVMVFQDENYNQLACNDNINTNEGLVQSKITDFPVTAGQDIYIRVSGVGTPTDPNGEAGVVLLDFSFSTPMGTEGDGGPYQLSVPYPNPATGKFSLDVTPRTTGEVIIDIQDMMGKPALTENKGVLSAGARHTVDVNVSALPAGAYLVNVRGNNNSSVRKLMVIK